MADDRIARTLSVALSEASEVGFLVQPAERVAGDEHLPRSKFDKLMPISPTAFYVR